MKATKKTIAARFRPNTIKKLEEIAEEKEMSISELIRFIVENYLLSR